MSNPLVEERPGDLSAMGLQSRNDLEPFDEIAAREEQEQVQEPEPKEETPEVQAQEPEGEEQEDDLLESYLADQRKSESPSEEAENTRLRQENARLQEELKGRIAAMEDRLSAPVEPVEQRKSLLKSPVIRATLDALREEDPVQYEAALVELAAQQAETKLSSRIQGLEEQTQARELERETQEKTTAFWRQVSQTLQGIREKGGLAAKIIDDLDANKAGSLLGSKFERNPAIMFSSEGIRGAVQDVEAELRAHAGSRQSEQPGQVLDEVQVSGGGRSVSRRGLTLDEKPKTRTPEEEIADSIVGAGGGAKAALDFMR